METLDLHVMTFIRPQTTLGRASPVNQLYTAMSILIKISEFDLHTYLPTSRDCWKLNTSTGIFQTVWFVNRMLLLKTWNIAVYPYIKLAHIQTTKISCIHVEYMADDLCSDHQIFRFLSFRNLLPLFVISCCCHNFWEVLISNDKAQQVNWSQTYN